MMKARVRPTRPVRRQIGRWHAPGSAYGWHIVERGVTAVAELEAVWADPPEVVTTPVIEDQEAAVAAARVHGK